MGGKNDDLKYDFGDEDDGSTPDVVPNVYQSREQSKQFGLTRKNHGLPPRRMTNAVQRQLNASVMFRSQSTKLRDVYAIMVTEALTKGKVSFIDGREIQLGAKLWTDFAIKVMEHLDGKVGGGVVVDNSQNLTIQATDDDLESLGRIYGAAKSKSQSQ